MLRVIGGSVRGRRLKGPPVPRSRTGKDVRTTETRPTSDLVRGVIFNMLDAMGADYSRVLDLYAGTGALGIEALSRGDGDAVFIERDRAAVDVIRANLQACRFEDRATVYSLTTARAAHHLRDSPPFTLILADPPYYDEDAPDVVAATVEALADTDAVAVFEHHRRLEPPDQLGGLALYRSRRHGDTVISIYGDPAGGDEEDEA